MNSSWPRRRRRRCKTDFVFILNTWDLGLFRYIFLDFDAQTPALERAQNAVQHVHPTPMGFGLCCSNQKKT